MDDKKISAENIAEEEILADEQLDNVAGGTNTGPGEMIQMQTEDDNTPRSFTQGGAG